MSEQRREELKEIYDEIARSQELLQLEEDWDSYGGKPIKAETLEKAKRLLLAYATKCLDTYNTAIDGPHISPLSSGGVDVEWHTDNYGLLLMIPENDRQATLYGSRYVKPWKWGDGNPPARQDEIEKTIDVSQVDEELAKWLAKSTEFNKERGPAPERQA